MAKRRAPVVPKLWWHQRYITYDGGKVFEIDHTSSALTDTYTFLGDHNRHQPYVYFGDECLKLFAERGQFECWLAIPMASPTAVPRVPVRREIIEWRPSAELCTTKTTACGGE